MPFSSSIFFKKEKNFNSHTRGGIPTVLPVGVLSRWHKGLPTWCIFRLKDGEARGLYTPYCRARLGLDARC